ncbi:MAG: putative repair photolyase, partial [Bacteriovoracaceae bacterium]|nr:putative repair photolyase [Bacteriovoracaceae bacterium]
METIISQNSAPSFERGKLLNIRRFDGPVSGPMWAKAHSIKSKYPDTFNYGIFDDLHKRFDDGKVRGGVVFKSFLKLANSHASCRLCHYSFELDIYGRGCIHNCVYCYAKEQLTRHGYWNEPMPFPLDLGEFRKIFATVFESDKKSEWRDILEKRIPVRIGSMSDSFMWMDKKYKVAKEVLKILNFYRYPHIIFTRSDLIGEDDYIKTLDPNLATVQMSISSINDELNKAVEPGAPSAARRLKALRNLSKAGIWTAVRVNPL